MGMKKYEVMKFRIGDLFYENDDLSSHMLRLFAIYNDLIVVYKYIGDTENLNSKNSTQKSPYLMRLLASHSKEALDALGKANKNEDFRKLYEDFPESAERVLKNKYQYGSMTLGSVKSHVLRPIRNNFFHYITDLDKGLKELKEYDSKIIRGKIGDEKVGDLYFEVVDRIISYAMPEEVVSEPAILLELSINIIVFIIQIFEKFHQLPSKVEKFEIVEE